MTEQDITIEQAAELLNVSPQYVVRILDEGQMPYHTVGYNRQIRLSDLLEYKKKRDAARRVAMEELYRVSDEVGLYDIDEFPKKD